VGWEVWSGSSGYRDGFVFVKDTSDYFNVCHDGWFRMCEVVYSGRELVLMLCPCRDTMLDVSQLLRCGFNGSVIQ
jgi:hypothetical protein